MAVIKGLPQLRRVLAKMPNDFEGQRSVEALVKGAEVLRDSMERRAPRNEGHLARGIVVDLKVVRGRAVARIGPSKDVFYGKFQEFGTKSHAAQPFMRPALDEDGPLARRLIEHEMARTVEAVADQQRVVVVR